MGIEVGTDSARRRAQQVGFLIFFQMLPATLVTPAIRPLFAAYHGGSEGAMHAFMSLNMLGGILAAPWLGALADRSRRPGRLLALAAGLDALLLAALAAPLPTGWTLLMRTVEGGAHVGAATLLLAEAAALRRLAGDGSAMGLAGAGLMLAIALGSALGGAVVGVDTRWPFWMAAALSAVVALAAAFRSATAGTLAPAPTRHARLAQLWFRTELRVPAAAAFVERFSVGCIVVSFALYAHRGHGLADSAVGFLYALLTLPFALLMYPIARLGEHVPRSFLLWVGAIAYTAALSGLGHVPTVALPGVMAIAGIASALIFSPILSYAGALAAPGERGRAMALLNAAGCLGMFLGPAVAGLLTALLSSPSDPLRGYRAVFLLASLSVVVWAGASLPWLLRRFGEERAGADARTAGTSGAALSPASL